MNTEGLQAILASLEDNVHLYSLDAFGNKGITSEIFTSLEKLTSYNDTLQYLRLVNCNISEDNLITWKIELREQGHFIEFLVEPNIIKIVKLHIANQNVNVEHRELHLAKLRSDYEEEMSSLKQALKKTLSQFTRIIRRLSLSVWKWKRIG